MAKMMARSADAEYPESEMRKLVKKLRLKAFRRLRGNDGAKALWVNN